MEEIWKAISQLKINKVLQEDETMLAIIPTLLYASEAWAPHGRCQEHCGQNPRWSTSHAVVLLAKVSALCHQGQDWTGAPVIGEWRCDFEGSRIRVGCPHSTHDEGRWFSQIMRGLQGHSKPGHHPCIPGRWSKLFKAGSCPCVLAAAFGRGFKEICHCEYLQRVIPIQPPTLRVNVAQVPLVVVFVVFQPQRSSHYCLKHEEGATLNSVRGLYSLQRLQCGFPVEGSGTFHFGWTSLRC